MFAVHLRRLIVASVLIVLPQLACAASAAPPPAVATAAALRGAVTVTGPDIRLGDLFTNVGDKAGIRIGNAPQPGSPLSLDAIVLQRLAKAHDLAWHPASMQERCVVERASELVTAEEVSAAVLLALTEKGVSAEGLDVALTLGTRRLYRPRESRLAVDAVSVDPAGRRFSALLAIETPGEAKQTVALTGRLLRTVDVPVLLRPLRAGEVIDERSVGSAQVPDGQVSSNAVRNRETLVGQSARRALAAGSPILISDLQPVKVVSKGQPVTLVLEMPGMQLSARGVAQEDGGMGATIHVLNERSKTTVLGVVTSPSTVSVTSLVGASR